MPSLGPWAPLAGGSKLARGTPALTLPCSGCRRDFGDTQGLGSACPLQERTLQSPHPGTNSPALSHTQCPSFTPNCSTRGGDRSVIPEGQKCDPRGMEVPSQRDKSVTPKGQKCDPRGDRSAISEAHGPVWPQVGAPVPRVPSPHPLSPCSSRGLGAPLSLPAPAAEWGWSLQPGPDPDPDPCSQSGLPTTELAPSNAHLHGLPSSRPASGLWGSG